MLNAIQGYTMGDALKKTGITMDYLAKKLKLELNSKEVKFLKVKKNVKADEVSSQINKLLGKDGKPMKKRYVIIEETAEEMVVAVNIKYMSIRQRAREDAQKLMGLYPAEKREITDLTAIQYTDEEKATLKKLAMEKAKLELTRLKDE